MSNTLAIEKIAELAPLMADQVKDALSNTLVSSVIIRRTFKDGSFFIFGDKPDCILNFLALRPAGLKPSYQLPFQKESSGTYFWDGNIPPLYQEFFAASGLYQGICFYYHHEKYSDVVTFVMTAPMDKATSYYLTVRNRLEKQAKEFLHRNQGVLEGVGSQHRLYFPPPPSPSVVDRLLQQKSSSYVMFECAQKKFGMSGEELVLVLMFHEGKTIFEAYERTGIPMNKIKNFFDTLAIIYKCPTMVFSCLRDNTCPKEMKGAA